jgi:hypothetical protein
MAGARLHRSEPAAIEQPHGSGGVYRTEQNEDEGPPVPPELLSDDASGYC